jgi:hypothetical protein
VIADWEGCAFEINVGVEVEYYLYFQYTIPDKISKHGFAMYKRKSTKAHHRRMLSDVDKCTNQVNLLACVKTK